MCPANDLHDLDLLPGDAVDSPVVTEDWVQVQGQFVRQLNTFP
jgi:hypothetical protein